MTKKCDYCGEKIPHFRKNDEGRPAHSLTVQIPSIDKCVAAFFCSDGCLHCVSTDIRDSEHLNCWPPAPTDA